MIVAATARSSQPWNGNDMDTYADDLSELIETIGPDRCHPGRPLGRAAERSPATSGATAPIGSAKAVLVGAVTPLMLKNTRQSRRPADRPRSTPSAPASPPTVRSSSRTSRRRSTAPTGPARRSARASRDAFWFQGMQGGLKNQLDCIKAFSETDFTEDLKKFDVPTLIIHGGRRPDCADSSPRLTLVQTREERDPEGLPGWLARPRRHAQKTSSTPIFWHSLRPELTA